MKRAQSCVVLGCCFLGIGTTAQAQSRKAGLWEVTSNMTWQQSPFPSGMSAPAGSPFGGGAHTNSVCVTQEQIDKFGAPAPQTRGDCQVTNVSKQATGMTAEMSLLRKHERQRNTRRLMDRRRPYRKQDALYRNATGRPIAQASRVDGRLYIRFQKRRLRQRETNFPSWQVIFRERYDDKYSTCNTGTNSAICLGIRASTDIRGGDTPSRF